MNKKALHMSSDQESAAQASQPQALPADEKKRLLEALETARENVKPTVRRLMESESVSTDLLSMRLEKCPPDAIG
jgi:hypothetical protein